MRVARTILTIGHGRREGAELVACLREAEVATLVDVRRYPGSRRNPQFNQTNLAATLAEAGIEYRHEVELGGHRSGEPGEERFACVGSFAGYAARMGTREWQDALARLLDEDRPCIMCAETQWQRCHRRFISELLAARGHEVAHLLRPGEHEAHQPHPAAEARNGRLYLCGSLVA
jgi:uncharacterized protein (DUF488 family)